MTITTNFSEWATHFDQNVDAIMQYNNQVQVDAVYDLKEVVVNRTPIGKPGTWKSTPPPGYTPGQAREGWYVEKDGDILILANDVVYIQKLEEGWSQQAPAGMLRVSLLEWDQLVQKAVKKRRAP